MKKIETQKFVSLLKIIRNWSKKWKEETQSEA